MPPPRRSPMIIVSTWSSAVWPVATASAPTAPAVLARNSYRARRAAISSEPPVCRLSAPTSDRPTRKGSPRRRASAATNSASRREASPRRQWSRCATTTARPSSSRRSSRAWRRAMESGPPETATSIFSPARSTPEARAASGTFTLLKTVVAILRAIIAPPRADCQGCRSRPKTPQSSLEPHAVKAKAPRCGGPLRPASRPSCRRGVSPRGRPLL